MMTKEQEVKALEKIKKILAEAGEDSYIGWAFAGCVETAESNIENDFADSMQSKLEMERDTVSVLKAQIEELKAENERLKEEQLSKEDHATIKYVVGSEWKRQAAIHSESEKAIMENIADIESEAFLAARKNYMLSGKLAEKYESLYDRLPW